jgi:hypothetical protein
MKTELRAVLMFALLRGDISVTPSTASLLQIRQYQLGNALKVFWK